MIARNALCRVPAHVLAANQLTDLHEISCESGGMSTLKVALMDVLFLKLFVQRQTQNLGHPRVRFEVSAVVTVTITNFCSARPYSLVDVSEEFPVSIFGVED
jgi:hypothetical protein